MKAFKIDFDGKKFIKIAFDVKSEVDFSDDPETNLAESVGNHNCNEDIMDKYIDMMNKNLVKAITEDSNRDSIMVKKCKDCGKYFIIDYNEFMWFKNKDLSIPARCVTCRTKRKNK